MNYIYRVKHILLKKISIGVIVFFWGAGFACAQDKNESGNKDLNNPDQYQVGQNELSEEDIDRQLLLGRKEHPDPGLDKLDDDYYLAAMHGFAGDCRGAIPHAEKFIKKYPKFTRAYIDLAGCYYTLGDYQEGKKYHQKAMELLQNEKDPQKIKEIEGALKELSLYEKNQIPINQK